MSNRRAPTCDETFSHFAVCRPPWKHRRQDFSSPSICESYKCCLSSLHILTDLRNTPHLRDYTLRFKGEEFPVHRALLVLYSKYYHKLFTLNWVDSDDSSSDYDHLPVS
ncbi:hypothetical protein P9112_012831 [Eukaryota sp. TZLM1-RC]